MEVVFEVLGISLIARNPLLVGWHNSSVLGLDQSKCETFIAVEHLDTNVIVEELVVVLQDLVGFLEVRDEFDWASLRQFSECVDCRCLLIKLSQLHIELFVLAVRVQTETGFFGFTDANFHVALLQHFDDNLVKDGFEFATDGISKEVEEAEACLSDLGIAFSGEDSIDDLQVGKHHSLEVLLLDWGFLLAELVGQLALQADVLGPD